MKRLGCKKVKESILENIKETTQKYSFLEEKPTLAVILVGKDPASETYVRKKIEMCQELGFNYKDILFNADITTKELVTQIEKLNADNSVHGILVQLPLPSHIEESAVINAIDPLKDVDGFTIMNTGKLSLGEITPDTYIPCTPAGIVEILKYYDIPLEGKNIVMIGRSNIVGKPMAELLSSKNINATVTLCHSKTQNLKQFTKQADIIIIATGQPKMLTADMTRDDAVIIDVGVNRIADSSREKGFRLVGDADYDSFKETNCQVTPVPGGVGLTTVAMLMKNTLQSFLIRKSFKIS